MKTVTKLYKILLLILFLSCQIHPVQNSPNPETFISFCEAIIVGNPISALTDQGETLLTFKHYKFDHVLTVPLLKVMHYFDTILFEHRQKVNDELVVNLAAIIWLYAQKGIPSHCEQPYAEFIHRLSARVILPFQAERILCFFAGTDLDPCKYPIEKIDPQINFNRRKLFALLKKSSSVDQINLALAQKIRIPYGLHTLAQDIEWGLRSWTAHRSWGKPITSSAYDILSHFYYCPTPFPRFGLHNLDPRDRID